MGAKSQFLQIRVTPAQKALLKRAAAAAGQDLSTYVLARAIPGSGVRFTEAIRALARADDYRYALAELNDLLTAMGGAELRDAVAGAELDGLSPFLRNYVAAMVEQAANARNVAPPDWTRRVPPLATPWFATPLPALRLHLLRASPVAFKRRNLFIDASLGSRV